MRQIGCLEQYVVQRGLNLIELSLYLFNLMAKICHFVQERGSIFTSGLRIANLLRRGISTRLQFLRASLKVLALRFQLTEFRHGKHMATGGEQPRNMAKVPTQ
jgi:hypothetical protein